MADKAIEPERKAQRGIYLKLHGKPCLRLREKD